MSQKEYTSGSVELEDPILEIEKPARFAVVFFNDDYTPMEFVVYVIQQFFGFDHAKATEVMLQIHTCLLYTSPSPRDRTRSRMPSSA